MTQVGEGVAVLMIGDNPDEEPEKTEKKPITLRISVFFDGTGNNRANIKARKGEGDSAAYETVKKQDPGAQLPGQDPKHVGTSNASFENDYSNVSYLEEGVKSTDENDYHTAIYVEGAGTQDLRKVSKQYEDDMRAYQEQLDIWNQTAMYASAPVLPPSKPKFNVDSGEGNGMATGETGIYAKMHSAVNEISDWYQGLLENEGIDPDQYYIVKISIDLFGFSRGAATARSFIHFIMKGEQTFYTKVKTRSRGARSVKKIVPTSNLLMKLSANGLDIAIDALEFGFVGVFDTVSSYVIALKSNVDSLHLDAITHAKKVYHLAAAEEHRLCFSLTDISSAKKKGTGEEYFLPGVHSDVGGGYREARAIPEFGSILDHGWTMKALSKLSVDKIKLSDYAKQLEKEGWFSSQKIYDIETSGVKEKRREIDVKKEKRLLVGPMGYGSVEYEVETEITMYRNAVKNSYRTIAFNLMFEEMKKNGFSFEFNAKIKNAVPEELAQVNNDIKDYVASVGNSSKASHWFEKQSSGCPGGFNIEKLRNEHLHYSSTIGLGMWPRIRKGKKTRELYQG
ncbi:MAG: DUF2235 domain-containing protein [Agarilytica sp.]